MSGDGGGRSFFRSRGPERTRVGSGNPVVIPPPWGWWDPNVPRLGLGFGTPRVVECLPGQWRTSLSTGPTPTFSVFRVPSLIRCPGRYASSSTSGPVSVVSTVLSDVRPPSRPVPGRPWSPESVVEGGVGGDVGPTSRGPRATSRLSGYRRVSSRASRPGATRRADTRRRADTPTPPVHPRRRVPGRVVWGWVAGGGRGVATGADTRAVTLWAFATTRPPSASSPCPTTTT